MDVDWGKETGISMAGMLGHVEAGFRGSSGSRASGCRVIEEARLEVSWSGSEGDGE